MLKKKTIGIGEIAKVSGVSEKQLRYWQEVGYIAPETVVCGERTYRRYSDADVMLVSEIKRLLDEGFTLLRAVSRAKENLGGKQ